MVTQVDRAEVLADVAVALGRTLGGDTPVIVLDRLGGYRTDDPMVFGWEDWELWLRIAAEGGYGIHVPQMLGRYRTQQESMLSTTNIVADQMLDHLRDLYPDLPWAPWL